MPRVLIVDDEPWIARTLGTTLTKKGYDVTSAASGKDALYALSEAIPDVMLLDISLPDITGWEVLRRLSPADRERVPVVVFSASPLARSRIDEFRPAGVLVKPFPIDALERLLDEVTGGAARQAAAITRTT